MKTLKNITKIALILAVFLGMVTLIAPVKTQAVTIDELYQEIADLQLKIKIQMLLDQIATLNQQIADMTIQQNRNTQAVSNIESRVEIINTNTAPRFGNISAPTSLSVDFSCENGKVKVDTNVAGAFGEYLYIDSPQVTTRRIWPTNTDNPFTTIRLNPEVYHWEAGALTEEAMSKISQDHEWYRNNPLLLKTGIFDGTICVIQ